MTKTPVNPPGPTEPLTLHQEQFLERQAEEQQAEYDAWYQEGERRGWLECDCRFLSVTLTGPVVKRVHAIASSTGKSVSELVMGWVTEGVLTQAAFLLSEPRPANSWTSREEP